MLNADTNITNGSRNGAQRITRAHRRRQTVRHMAAVHDVSTNGRRDHDAENAGFLRCSYPAYPAVWGDSIG